MINLCLFCIGKDLLCHLLCGPCMYLNKKNIFFLTPHSDGRNKPAGEAVTALHDDRDMAAVVKNKKTKTGSALMEVQGNSGVGPAEGLFFPVQDKEVNWESVCRLELSFNPAAGGIQSPDVGKVRQP